LIKKAIATGAIILIELLALGVLIDTFFLKIIFSLIAFTFTCYFLLTGKQYVIKVKAYKKKVIIGFVYALAVISGILILSQPFPTVIVDPNLILNSFRTLSPYSIARIIAGYFITCIFPGIIIVTRLPYFENRDLIEKAGLIMIFSVIYSAILGSSMFILFDLFDPHTFIVIFVTSLIFFSGFIETLGYVKGRRGKVHFNEIYNGYYKKETKGVSLEKVFLAVIVVSYVLLSYFQVFTAASLSGLLGSDPANYAIYANRYIYYNLYYWTYIGTPIFLQTISYVVGLPVHLAFAGLQFFQALLPLAVYFSITKILKNKRISLIATFFVLFLNGITSLLLLLNYSQLTMYITGTNQLEILWNLFNMTGSPGGMSPHHLTASSFDIPLILFSIAYIYEYLEKKGNQGLLLFLASLFTGAANFFHSFNFMPLVIILLIILFIGRKKEKTLYLLLSTGIMILFFEFISEFYLSGYIPLRISRSGLALNPTTFTSCFGLIVILLALMVTLLFTRKIVKNKYRTEILKVLNFQNSEKVFVITGFVMFFLATALYLKNAYSISHVESWETPMIVYPWFFIVYKFYGVVFLLAIVSIPYLSGIEEKSLGYLMAITLSILCIAFLSLIIPTLLPTELFYYRQAGYLLYPLAIFAAIPLARIQEKGLHEIKKWLSKRNKTLFLFLVLLPSLTVIQTISQAHSYEVWYLIGQQPVLSTEVTNSINWINYYVPKGNTILPLSQSAERILCNLIYGIKVIPISSSEFIGLLSEKSSEKVIGLLTALNINYIYATENDLQHLKGLNSGLLEVLNASTVVYHIGTISIYKIR